jgi:hypothetical protein
MPALRMILVLAAGVLIAGALLMQACGNERNLQKLSAVPSHLQRSQRVQQHYDNYVKRLQAFYESLASAVRLNAPHLIPLLEAPKPVQHGYQILPRIVADASPSESPGRSQSAGYSWPWTDRLVDHAVKVVIGAEKELARAAASSTVVQQSRYEKLVRKFRQFQEQQQNIDAHIQYNRLWQAAIAADLPGYDRETILHDAVLERQAIREVLETNKRAPAKASRVATVRGSAGIAVGLKNRENLLARHIDEATAPVMTPYFVQAAQRNRRAWVVHVPFYTDIHEREFVQSLAEEIQRIWHLRDGDMEFRVELAFCYLTTEELYGTRNPPQVGQAIDSYRHLDLFPPDGAILTTGAHTTHVYGRAIILGPHDLTPRILAHEFGHILGFKDLYFRGYKDLGKNGFQVMEVVADARDIMGTPATGLVLRKHFDRLVEKGNEAKAADGE